MAQDLKNNTWNWETPKLISPPGIDDKDACLFPRKIEDRYVFLHRPGEAIWIDFVADLDFAEGKVLTGERIITPRSDKWDTKKIGIAAPPLELKEGWLLLYHGIDAANRYSVGALLLELENPRRVVSRLDYPILSPERIYEKSGAVPNVVFPCGMVVREEKLILYYGGADAVVAAASIPLAEITEELLRHRI